MTGATTTMNYIAHDEQVWFENLEAKDHVWLIDDFTKTSTSAFYDVTVVAILRGYLLQKCFELKLDEHQRRYISTGTGEPIYVSLSHSKNWLLLGLSRHAPLGVDIEVLDERRRYKAIARRYFPQEAINNYHDFLVAWTAREAFVKAEGCAIDYRFATITTEQQLQNMVIGFKGTFSHSVVHYCREHTIAAVCRRGQRDLKLCSVLDLSDHENR